MLLVVDQDWRIRKCYMLQFTRRGLIPGLDYCFPRSFGQVQRRLDVFGDRITHAIIDHKLAGKETGADVVRFLSEVDHNIDMVRCSYHPELGYSFGMKWFSKYELGRAIHHLLGPIVKNNLKTSGF